jgi:hypothetical protein
MEGSEDMCDCQSIVFDLKILFLIQSFGFED